MAHITRAHIELLMRKYARLLGRKTDTEAMEEVLRQHNLTQSAVRPDIEYRIRRRYSREEADEAALMPDPAAVEDTAAVDNAQGDPQA